MKQRLFAATAAAVVMVVPLGPASAQSDMTAYAGSVGGLYMETMSVWVSQWEREIDGVSITPVLGGGTTNPINVSNEDPNSAIGITDTISTADAWEGTGDIGQRAPEGLQDLRALFRFNALSYSAYAARGSAVPDGVTTLRELLEAEPALTWAFMQRGNPGELTNRRVLEAYGLSLDDLQAWGGSYSFNPHAEIASLMIDGHADVFMVNTRAPAAFMLDMDASIDDLTWLALDEEAVDELMQNYGGYVKVEHPVEHYDSLDEPFLTAAVDHVLFVHADMDEELAYQFTKVALENAEDMRSSIAAMATFDPAVVCTDVGAFPLHEGAKRACEELGLLN